MIKIDGIAGETLQKVHDFYAPKTVITSHLWDAQDELFDITLSEHAIVKINAGDITIDLGGLLYTIEKYDYVSLTAL